MVTNLSQLKKYLTREGAKFTIVEHHIKPQWTGQKRVVKTTQTNGIYSAIDGEPDNELSNLNYGKGIWMPFDKAANWTFNSDGTITNVNIRGVKAFTLKLTDESSIKEEVSK